MKKTNLLKNVALASACVFGLALNAHAADYSTNRGELIGPTYRTDANFSGFTIHRAGLAQDSTVYCVPRNSSLIVTDRDATNTYVKFHGLGIADTAEKQSAYAAACGPNTKVVVYDTVYQISNTEFDLIPLRSSGIAYGALVVPFKFRLGSDKKISSSATIAPYIGARWHRLQKWGVEAMPIVSAGLALVPVRNPTNNETDTKAAFSTAFGFTLNSTTQKTFSAGVLVGKDFLGKSDRAFDPSVNKLWLSIWVGTTQ